MCICVSLRVLEMYVGSLGGQGPPVFWRWTLIHWTWEGGAVLCKPTVFSLVV